MKLPKIALFFSFLVLIFLLIILLWPLAVPPSLSPLSNLPPSPTSPPTSTPTPARVTFGLAGDLGLGRHITSTARAKNDFSWSFQGVSTWLQANDFNLANLESPIIADCPTGYTGTFTFCGDKRFLPYLSDNKFVFNLANNHIFNYGQEGFFQTQEFLTQKNIPFFYSDCTDCNTKFVTYSVNGILFGFLGYDFITHPDLGSNQILADVTKYNSSVDWLIVSLHWGNEYRPDPETWRISLAHDLIDAGADIIHGHHPHVWQEPEVYRDRPIFYSLGNFIFDQSWSYETSHTNIVRLTLTKNQLDFYQSFPVEIVANSQPQLSSSSLPPVYLQTSP